MKAAWLHVLASRKRKQGNSSGFRGIALISLPGLVNSSRFCFDALLLVGCLYQALPIPVELGIKRISSIFGFLACDTILSDEF